MHFFSLFSYSSNEGEKITDYRCECVSKRFRVGKELLYVLIG